MLAAKPFVTGGGDRLDMYHPLHRPVVRARHWLQCRDSRQPTKAVRQMSTIDTTRKRGRACVFSPNLSHWARARDHQCANKAEELKSQKINEATGNVNTFQFLLKFGPFRTDPQTGSEHFSTALWYHAIEEHSSPASTLQHIQALESDASSARVSQCRVTDAWHPRAQNTPPLPKTMLHRL